MGQIHAPYLSLRLSVFSFSPTGFVGADADAVKPDVRRLQTEGADVAGCVVETEGLVSYMTDVEGAVGGVGGHDETAALVADSSRHCGGVSGQCYVGIGHRVVSFVDQAADEFVLCFLHTLHQQDGVAADGEADGVVADAGTYGVGHSQRIEPLGYKVIFQVIVDEDDTLTGGGAA